MTEQEARAVIAALESGREFTFSSYSADARETLVYNRATGQFVLTHQHAWDPGATERSVLTGDALEMRLRDSFSYPSFGLPPVGRAAVRSHRR